jgi:hypothetical protein
MLVSPVFLLLFFVWGLLPGGGVVSHGHERVVADFAVDLGPAGEGEGSAGAVLPDSLLSRWERRAGFEGSYGIDGWAAVNRGDGSIAVLLERYRGSGRPRITLLLEHLDRIPSLVGTRARLTVHRRRGPDPGPSPELLLDEEREVETSMSISLYADLRLGRGDWALVRLIGRD